METFTYNNNKMILVILNDKLTHIIIYELQKDNSFKLIKGKSFKPIKEYFYEKHNREKILKLPGSLSR